MTCIFFFINLIISFKTDIQEDLSKTSFEIDKDFSCENKYSNHKKRPQISMKEKESCRKKCMVKTPIHVDGISITIKYVRNIITIILK